MPKQKDINKLIDNLISDIRQYKVAYGVEGWPTTIKPTEWVAELQQLKEMISQIRQCRC